MKKARITMEVLYNPENSCDPSEWDYDQMLDLEPYEKVEIIEIKELKNEWYLYQCRKW